MIKSEFIAVLVTKLNELNESQVTEGVNLILKYIGEDLATGGRIEVRDFGSFDVACRPPRIAHNPKTLVKLEVSEKHSVHFKPGKSLRDRVNESRARIPIVDDARDEE